ncbi:MAG: hypothetical protein QOE47_585 [Pyrinomonadaceae bacterium]|jgi:hypothetical protein|nr:hypothetical protein [Pyrinomonadaceae bacterium]
MKSLKIAAAICLLSAVASAQGEVASSSAALTDAPDVRVLKQKWRREVRHPALDEDPFLAGRQATLSDQDKKETIRGNVINKQLGRDPAPLPSGQPTLISTTGPRPVYVYEVKVMNTGTKTIRTLVWEYMFFDPDTQREVGRHLYESRVNLRPGKSKQLDGFSLSPQTRTVDVGKTGKNLEHQYLERVVIQQIEYADGSSWRRDAQ